MTSVAELEDELARPRPEDCAVIKRLRGDVMILGAGGKMGPSLARLVRRAADEAGAPCRVLAVSRFASEKARRELADDGIETIACDLLERDQIARLPDCSNILFLAGRKFG